MYKRIIKWSALSVFLLGLIGFLVLYQEYGPLNASELTVEHVRSNSLVGDFIYPSDKTKLPAIVFLGGSGGGLGNEVELKSLALNGFSVLSLAYFKAAGLPDKLENIPLEYFKNAFDWLGTREQVDTSKVLLLGVSRGAELALLLASIYPQVKGVIAYSPGCFILPNATEIEDDTLRASWTLKNSPIPFAPIRRFSEDTREAVDYKTYIDPLLSQNDPAGEYMIKVEKINGPILLISGADDLVWPASGMATRIEERLTRKGFGHRYVNAIF